jgi:membrane protease YdiL (CAAX protease family)
MTGRPLPLDHAEDLSRPRIRLRMNDINVGTRPPPWGYWATFGWALLAALLSAMIAVVVTIWWRPDILSKPTDLKDDGPLLCAGTIVWVAFQISALALVARLAHWPPGEYLGLIRPSRRDAALALAFLSLFLPGFDAVTYLLGKDIVTPFQVASYRSARAAGELPLLWFTFVVVAPTGEEIMFRGFLYRGWVRSQRGVVPGVLVISALWAAIHTQYDWFGLLQIFTMGLLFGWMRWRSGSAALTILMHGIANLWAMMETVVKMQGLF